MESENNEEETIFIMPDDIQIMADLCDMMGKLTHANCKKTTIEIAAKYDTAETVDLVASALNYFYQTRYSDRYLFTLLGSGLIKRFKNYLWASLILIGNGMYLYSLYLEDAITIQQIKQRCELEKTIYYFFAPELGIPHYYSRFEDLFELTPVTNNKTRDDSEENCIELLKEELSENNYAKYNELRTNGYLLNSVEMMIIKDDLQSFTAKVNEKGFDTNLIFDESPFIGNRKYSLISFAARYGAKECFKLLKKKNCEIDNNVVKNAVFGGCMEIIKELYDDKAPFEDTLPIAISTHRPEVIDFIRTHFPEFTFTPLDCIMGFNISMFGDSTLLFDQQCMHYSVMTGYVPLVHFFVMQELNINALDENHETPLIHATRLGFYEMVYYLVKSGADPNIKGISGETPLYIASLMGIVEIGNLLLNEKADPTIRTNKNDTPLNAVAFSGATVLADSLLVFNSDINQENPPIATSIIDGRLNMLDYFLKKGADPNIRVNSKGETPLHLAVKKLDARFARLLSEYKADPTIEDNDGITPLMIAFKTGNPMIAKGIINDVSVIKKRFSNGKTLLHYAAMSESTVNINVIERIKRIEAKRIKCQEEGTEFFEEEEDSMDMYDIINNAVERNNRNKKKERSWRKNKFSKFDNENVEFLLRIGLDINQTDGSGRTPLCCAIEEKQYTTMFFLVENGADVNVKSENANTPLHLCARDGSSQAVEFLINHGGAINDVNNDAKTPLDLASEEGHVDCVIALLSNGAMFTTPFSVTTAAHLAAERNQTEVVRFFLSCNFQENGKITLFNKEIRNDDRETMLHVACRCGAKETVELLVRSGSYVDAEDNNGDSPLSLALYNNHLDIAQILLNSHCDPDTINSKGRPILFWCIENNKEEAIALLISNDADPNVTDFNNKTTLQLAAEISSPRWIRFLSKFHANVDPVYEDGDTPLIKACKSFDREVIEALIDCGANVNFQDREGKTPLHYIAPKGKMKVIRSLVYSHADPTIKDNDGDAPIDLIPESKELPFVDMCLSNGFDIDYLVDGENTLLFLAVYEGKISKVSFYVERHATIDCTDREGRTPLYHAILLENVPVITYLIDHGADPTKARNDGKTPIDAAKESGNNAVMMAVDKSFVDKSELKKLLESEDEIRKLINEEIEKSKLCAVVADDDNSDTDEDEEEEEFKANIIDINKIRTLDELNVKKKVKKSIHDLLDIEGDLDENGKFVLKREGSKGKTNKKKSLQKQKQLEIEKKKIQNKLMKKIKKKQLKEKKKLEAIELQRRLEAEAKLSVIDDDESEDEKSDNEVEIEKAKAKENKDKKRFAFDENSDIRPYGVQNSSYGNGLFLLKLLLILSVITMILYFSKP